MKWKSIIPIVLALVIALGGSFFLYKWLKMQSGPKQMAQIQADSDAVPVMVAILDLPWGTKLNSEMMKSVHFLKESLPEGYYSDSGTLKDRILIAALKKNEPITEAKLAPDSVTMGGVSAVVTPGKRAIAVKGDKVIGIASSGLHSNGYSLVRKICFEELKLGVDANVPGLETTIGEELLKPTRIYSETIQRLLKDLPILFCSVLWLATYLAIEHYDPQLFR